MTLGDRLLLRVTRVSAWAQPSVASDLPDLDNVIDVIAHRHKQVEKQFAPILHFHLHSSAPLKSLATSDDQSKVMSAETALSIRCLIIRLVSQTSRP